MEYTKVFPDQLWFLSLFICAVTGELNTGQWATEVHTELATQTVSSECDPFLDANCPGSHTGPSYGIDVSSEGPTEEALLGPAVVRILSERAVSDSGPESDIDKDYPPTEATDRSEESSVHPIESLVFNASEVDTVTKKMGIPGEQIFKPIAECSKTTETTTCVSCEASPEPERDPDISDEQRLFESLFRSYRKALRPLRSGSERLTVYFSLIIKDIIDVDERNQVLKLNVQLNESWVDAILHWDPEDYGGITELRIPASEMWVPDITLYNTGDSAVLAQGNVSSSNVIVHYSGAVRLITKPFVQHSTCFLNIRFFPFDVQKCALKFGSWTFDQLLIDLINGTTGPEFKDFTPNAQWDLQFTYFRRHVLWYDCCPERYVDITLYMGLKRKPLYYIHKLVMPILLLSALSMVGFLMPYNVGVVKANLSVTLFLSMTVFLLLVAETIPRTSKNVPLVTQYYIAIMILIALSTAMNVAILNIFHIGKESAMDVPRWMRRLVLFYLARIMLMEDIVDYWKKTGKKHKQKSNESSEREALLRRQRWFASRYGIKCTPREGVLNNLKAKTESGSMESLLHMDATHPEHEEPHHEYDTVDEKIPAIWRYRVKQIEGSVTNIHKHMVSRQKKTNKLQRSKREWALVATVMDRLFFIIYATTTISVTFFILWLAPRWQKELTMDDDD